MKNKKILIVEDEGIIAWDISDKLASIGIEQNSIVTSGEESLEKVAEEQPDLILMDINLSGTLDGIETANIIYNKYDIPIIFLTAYSDNSTLERAKTTNPFGYILKPFSVRELHTSINLAFYKYEMGKKLASSEKKYRSLFETSQAGILISTFPEGRIIDSNQSLRVMFGYESDEEFNGLLFTDVYSSGDDLSWLREELLKKQKIEQYEVNFKLRDKSTACFECSSWIREDGKFLDTIFIDITERKKIEEKLRQTQKMEAIGQIAAGIAHEINTPLAVISTRLEILKEEIQRSTCKNGVAQIDIINKNIYRMSSIIERLLGFSRSIDIAVSLINPAEVLEEVLFFVKTQATKKRIEIEIEINNNDILLKLNRNKLEQVFLNLIMNSFDAMPEGGKLKIKLIKTDTQVKILFCDSGEGMSSDIQAKIFDPFFTTKEAGKGTGLGMYICYGIIKEMNGEILIDSQLGKGTTISLLFLLPKKS